MNIKKALSVLTAAALSIGSFAALAVTANAAETFNLTHVIKASEFTLGEGLTNRLITNDFSNITTASQYNIKPYSDIFGSNMANIGKDDISYFGDGYGSSNTVSATVVPTESEVADVISWTAYVVAYNGRSFPKININGTVFSHSSYIDIASTNNYGLHCAKYDLTGLSFTAGSSYNITMGGDSSGNCSNLVALAIAPTAISASVGTAIFADEIAPNTSDISNIILNSDVSTSYDETIAPFGKATSLTSTLKCVGNNFNDISLNYRGLTIGKKYRIYLLENNWNNRFCGLYLNDTQIYSGNENDTERANLKNFAKYANATRNIATEYYEFLAENTSCTIKITTNTDKNTVAFIAVNLTDAADTRTQYSGSNNITRGTYDSSLSSDSYQRFFEKTKGNPADAYMTSIDFNSQYSAKNLSWYITNDANAIAKYGDVKTTFTGGTVYFGLVISGSQKDLDTITKVELR